MTTIKPLGNRILIKQDPVEETTFAGIVLSEPKQSTTATVIAVGPEVSTINEGDRIMFHSHIPLLLEEDNLMIIREQEAVYIIK